MMFLKRLAKKLNPFTKLFGILSLVLCPFLLGSWTYNPDGDHITSYNIWDEQWEVGGINSNNGSLNNSISNRIRSTDFILLSSNTNYYFSLNNVGNIWVFFYDTNYNYISYSNLTNTYYSNNDSKYIKICPDSTYGATYKNDISIIDVDNLQQSSVLSYYISSACFNYNDIVNKSIHINVNLIDLSKLIWSYNDTYGVWRANLNVLNRGQLFAINYNFVDLDPNELSINEISCHWSWWGATPQIFVKSNSSPTGYLYYQLNNPLTIPYNNYQNITYYEPYGNYVNSEDYIDLETYYTLEDDYESLQNDYDHLEDEYDNLSTEISELREENDILAHENYQLREALQNNVTDYYFSLIVSDMSIVQKTTNSWTIAFDELYFSDIEDFIDSNGFLSVRSFLVSYLSDNNINFDDSYALKIQYLDSDIDVSNNTLSELPFNVISNGQAFVNIMFYPREFSQWLSINNESLLVPNNVDTYPNELVEYVIFQPNSSDMSVSFNIAYSLGYDNGFKKGQDLLNVQYEELNQNYDQLKWDYQTLRNSYVRLSDDYNLIANQDVQINLRNLFWYIAEAPFESFKQIWNVDFLGLNIASFITGLLSIFVIVWLIKKIF